MRNPPAIALGSAQIGLPWAELAVPDHGGSPNVSSSLMILFSMTAAFAVGIVVSLLAPEKSAQLKFEDEKLRTYLGVGAE